MRAIGRALAAAALLTVSGAGGVRAFGDEPPAKPAAPTPCPKTQGKLLDALVGGWEFTGKAMGKDLAGVETWAKAADGTALVQELHVPDLGFDGLGVLRLAADGKTLASWWFDSFGQGGTWKFTGTLAEDRFDLASDEGGMHAEKRLRTQLGEWTIRSTSMGKAYRGTSRFRVAVGGHYAVSEYELHGEGEDHVGIGVHSVSTDGKSMRGWWFSNWFSDPMVVEGALTDSAWAAKGKHPTGGEMTIAFTKVEGGFESSFKMGEREVMKETYRRPSAK